jgi:hypothetical protein
MLTWENDVEATALRGRGWTISAIARHLGHDRKTIRDYLEGKRTPGERASSRPDPFEEIAEYARIRLSDDPHLWATTLFDEVVALGYPGSYPSFTRGLRTRALRPHCEPCQASTGRDHAIIDHPPGAEALCGCPHNASAPRKWVCGMHTSMSTTPSSTRRLATYRETVTSEQVAPCSATSRCQTRRAVCRCLRGISRSATSQASITDAHGSIAGHLRAGYDFRSGGTAESSACRTVRRCTRCRSASSRIDTSSTRASRRIASKSSTRVPT